MKQNKMKLKTAIKLLENFTKTNYPDDFEIVLKICDNFLSNNGGKYIKKNNKKSKKRKFTSKTYQKYLESPQWTEKREFVKECFKKQNRYKCEKCGSTKNLVVHHTYYTNKVLFSTKTYGLRLVCANCHKLIHKRANQILAKKITKTKSKAIIKATEELLPKEIEVRDYFSKNELLKKLGTIEYYKRLEDRTLSEVN